MHKRILLCAAFIAALLPLAIGPALAMNGSISIDNPTDKYVWITVYTSNLMAGWHIAKADCIAPKSEWKHSIYEPSDHEMKIRAEVKSGDCRSGNISDTYDVRKDVGTYPKLNGDIYFYKNSYFINFR
jgi:hypothetical protein